ncbi:MAG: hypothetical protein IKM29_04110 [Clostridia bacterium]|nr:hypothetical protein [Clostridia bacterium]
MTHVLPILFSLFATGGSFGCGRLVSKRNGLVLSGLLLGIGAAFATQNANIIRFAWMTGAFGVAGMFSCGNLDPENSAALVSDRKTRPTGILGLCIKGFLLFANPAGFVSLGIMSLGMVSHTLADTALLFCLFSAAPFAGPLLFNRGANRLSLSNEKNESWGKNLFIFASLFCVFAVKADFFSLTVSVTAGLFGALGQLAALLFRRPQVGYGDFAVGAAGGIGTALGIIIADTVFPEIMSSGWFVSDGKLSGYVSQEFSLAISCVWCLLWVLPIFLSRFRNEFIGTWLPDFLFCSLPFLLLSLGCFHAAFLTALPLAFFVCAWSKLRLTPKKTRFAVLFGLLWLCASAAVLSLTTSIPSFISVFGSAAFFLTFIFSSGRSGAGSFFPKFFTAVSVAIAVFLWFFNV